MTRSDEHGERIMAFVEEYQRTNHCSPSYDEIGRAVGLSSKDHVSRDLNKLKRQGLLSFTPGIGRSIVLSRTISRRRQLEPSAGHGAPAQPKTNHQAEPVSNPRVKPLDWTRVARELVGDSDIVQIMRVKGASMVDSSVNPGDLVVINPNNKAQNGELVAAWVKPEQRLTLKYYYRENGHIRLQPHNPSQPPLHLSPSDVEIRGRVLAIVRKAQAS